MRRGPHQHPDTPIRPYYGRALVERVRKLMQTRIRLRARIRQIDAEISASGVSRGTARRWATATLRDLRRVGLEEDRDA